MSRVALPAGLAAVAIAVAVAGCGSSSSGAASAASAATPKPMAATVATRHTALGTILVDANGRTLYLFEKDKGTTSACYGGCASFWPPLMGSAGKPVAGPGVTAAKLGTAKRRDGTMIVTYGGHPLYTFAGDAGPGATKGEGLDQFGAKWYVLAPSGDKIDNDE